ncbi:EAL domain-containing protein [Govanella unica]|uniref:EAL domain-containing protein n=1 Tax=Govanella unica TaxID=2975056 RepID=A0A9X3Z771_9PROT|nr:EAL domain-containing protein [Govania unica]MDA5193935.1 EAL domain-containing protein [Govania unica]
MSYILVAAFVGVVARRILGLDLLLAVMIAAVVALFFLQVHALILRRRERRDADHRMMALYEDYQSALGAIKDLRADLGQLQDGGGARQPDSELVSELRVLQTLLAQVAARESTGTASFADERPQRDGKTLPGSQSELLTVIHSALEENRVDLYLQPIVRLPSRKVAFYEAFSRVRDGSGAIIFPNDYLPLAEESGLIGTLDNILLFRCIQVIRRLGPRRPNVRFFCNIASGSLEDQDFFPQFIDFMINNLELADRLVFEFSQADVRRHSREVERSLASLGRRGFHFSMDHVTDINFDAAGLAARHFSFVKVSADLLMSGRSGIAAEDLRTSLARHQIDLIVEKIEDEAEVIEVLDFGVEYGQGYLFGEPRPSRDDDPRDEPMDLKTALRDM